MSHEVKISVKTDDEMLQMLSDVGKAIDNEKVPKENRTFYLFIDDEWKMIQTDEFGKVKPIK